MDIQIDIESFFTADSIVKNQVGAVRSFCDAFASLNLSDLGSVSIDRAGIKAAADNIEALSKKISTMVAAMRRSNTENELLYQQIDANVSYAFGEELTETQQQMLNEDFINTYEIYSEIPEVGLTSDQKKFLEENEESYYIFKYYESGYDELSQEAADLENWLKNNKDNKNFIGVWEEKQKKLLELKEQLILFEPLRTYMVENGLVEMSAEEEKVFAKKQMKKWGIELKEAREDGDCGQVFSIRQNMIDTQSVICESFISGVGKVIENIVVDGLAYVGNVVRTIPAVVGDIVKGNKDWDIVKNIWNETYDSITEDDTNKLRDWFYTETNFGQRMDENSALKYDGARAIQLQSYGTKAGEIVVATTVGIGTGGVAVSGLTGLFYGIGSGAEEQFSKVDEAGNYTHRNWKGHGLAALKGIFKGTEFLGYGSVAQATSTGISALKGSNFSEVMSSIKNNWGNMSLDAKKNFIDNFDELFKTSIKNTLKFKNANGVLGINDLYTDTISMLADQIYYNVNDGEFDSKSFLADVLVSVPLSFLGNMVGEFGGAYLESALSKGIKGKIEVISLDPDITTPLLSINFLKQILEDDETFNKFINFDNNLSFFDSNISELQYVYTIKKISDLYDEYDITLSDTGFGRAKYIVDNYKDKIIKIYNNFKERFFNFYFGEITAGELDELLSYKTESMINICDNFLDDDLDYFPSLIYNKFKEYVARAFVTSDLNLSQKSFDNISNFAMDFVSNDLDFYDYKKRFMKVSKYVLNDNSRLSDLVYQDYLRKLCNYIAKRDNLPEVVVNFKDFKSRADGIEAYAHYCSGFDTVEYNTLSSFKKRSLKGFKMYDIDTAFHEMRHHYQYYNMKSSNSVLNYYGVSDDIIWTSDYVNGDSYFGKNYKNIATEWDARKQAALQTEEFFSKVNPSLVKKYRLEINYQIKEARKASKKVPSFGGKTRTELLDEVIKNNPKYVSEYSVLQYKYHMDGSIRTKEDVQGLINYFSKLPESDENDNILTLLNVILDEVKGR